MSNGKRMIYKSLLVGIMAVILLCSLAVIGSFVKIGINTSPVTVAAEGTSLRDVSLTIDGLSADNEVESRIYGNSYNPITATAVDIESGNAISGYKYVIQYNDEELSGGWTTTVPKNAGRYAIRAYGAATAIYNEAVSDISYLTINPRTLEVDFIDEYKISNTEGGARQYNGKPYSVRAVFTNVVAGDNLSPITGGGKEVNASDTPYKFHVYGYSAPNQTIRNNYFMQNITYPYTITRVPMNVIWSDLTHKYDGTQKDPVVEWESAELMPKTNPEVVFEERINAGEYIVTATYNGADKDNFAIVNDTQNFTIEKAKIWVSFSGRAIRGHEAILRYIIGYSMSDPIPESEDDYIRANLNTVPLETDWTPESPMGQPYYIIVAGHNVAIYEDYDLMPNYVVEWRKAIYYPTKAQIKSIEWSENNYTYNASEQIITAVGIDEFNDRIDLEVTVNKEFVNAAKDYVATAALSAEDAQYYTISYYTATTKNYTIKPAAARVIWSDLRATYDGTQKDPAVAWESAAVMPEGNPEVVAGTRINAGSYTVTAEYNGTDKDNFTISNKTQRLTIAKANARVIWSGLSVTYDGTQKNPAVAWESAEVIPEGNPEVVAGTRINAGSYTVTAEYNGTDKDNFNITDTVNEFTVERSEIAVTITLAESFVTYGDDLNAEVTAPWHLDSEVVNNELLLGLISGYSAGDNVGEYTVTLDFEKAEDELRRSPDTFIDNYVITVVNDASLTVNKREITASDLEEWVTCGDAEFSGKTVIYDGNEHMIFAEINGSARGKLQVFEYLVNGETFSGATEVSTYNVTAVLVPVNGNYSAQGLTLSAILKIDEKPVEYDTETGSITPESADSNSDLPIGSGTGSGYISDTHARLFLIIVIIATVLGFIAILVIVKKFRDEYAGK